MTAFWLIACALALVAVALVVPPLLGGGRASGVSRGRLSQTLHEQRLAELAQERDQGNLTDAQYEEACREADRELLAELEATETETGAGAPATRTPWLAWLVGLGLPVLAVGLYLQFTTGLTSLNGAPTAESAQAKPDPQAIRAMVARLESRLVDHPDDRQGWLTLAQAHGALEDYAKAAQAYDKANTLKGLDDPGLLVGYAEALALANQRRVGARASQLLDKALKRAPEYPKALWLAGWGAYQREDYKTAANYWRRLASAAPADNADLSKALAALVDEAERLARGDGQSAAPASGAPPPLAAQDSGAAGDSAATSDDGIGVRVKLSPRLADQASANDTVFVYAQATDGPPAPLALARRRVQDLPLEVRLDDSLAMVPSMSLSSADRVTVTARVSKSGQAQPQSGDLLGRSQPVPSDDKATVSITIDDVVP